MTTLTHIICLLVLLMVEPDAGPQHDAKSSA